QSLSRRISITGRGTTKGSPREGIVNWRGCWSSTGEFNEVWDTYRIYLRNFIRDDAATLAQMVMKRFEQMITGADYLTTLRIANAATTLAARYEDLTSRSAACTDFRRIRS